MCSTSTCGATSGGFFVLILFGVLYCLLSLYCPLHSWGTEVDCVHLCLAGSDCFPLSYCSESPWDISLCSSHRQVSQSVLSADLCCFPLSSLSFCCLSSNKSRLISPVGTWSLSCVSPLSLLLIRLWCWTSPCAALAHTPCPIPSNM